MVLWYSGTQVLGYSGTQVLRYSCTLVLRYSGTLLGAKIFENLENICTRIILQLLHCADVFGSKHKIYFMWASWSNRELRSVEFLVENSFFIDFNRCLLLNWTCLLLNSRQRFAINNQRIYFWSDCADGECGKPREIYGTHILKCKNCSHKHFQFYNS